VVLFRVFCHTIITELYFPPAFLLGFKSLLWLYEGFDLARITELYLYFHFASIQEPIMVLLGSPNRDIIIEL